VANLFHVLFTYSKVFKIELYLHNQIYHFHKVYNINMVINGEIYGEIN